MAQSPQHIVIIGGGIIGCTMAYYITHHHSFSAVDTKVTIVETSAHGAAQGASGKAGGLVARWAYPKALVDVSFDEHIRLAELHNGSERWGWRYVNCGSWEGQGEDVTTGISDANEDPSGQPKSLEKTFGLKSEKLHTKRNKSNTDLPSDLNWMHPDLTESYTPMAPLNDTAQVHPYLFTKSMLTLAQERGATFLPSTKATSIRTSSSGHITGVDCTTTYTGSDMVSSIERIHLDATHVVLAAGAWSPSIVPALPITGTRAHSITIHPPAHAFPIAPYVLFTEIALPSSLHRPALHTSPEIYARPGTDGEVYACGPGDDAPLPNSVDDVVIEPSACQAVWEEVRSVSRILRAGRVDKRQACFLPTVLGRRQGPIVGEADSVARGLTVAAGHTCWGICNAPGTARAITELIMDGEIRCADLKALRPVLFL